LSAACEPDLVSQTGSLMPLDRQAKRILGMLAAAGMPARSDDLTAPKLREGMLRLAQTFDVRGVAIGAVENRDLPGVAGPVPVRIYTPHALSAEEPSAGIVYFHGGAGVFCSIETHEGLCRMLANASGCRVVSVDYRLAPEYQFPAAVEDAHFAPQWICAHAGQLRIDPARIAIGGDSFGATLAVVVCQRARESSGPTLALQVLFCPVTDLSDQSASWKAYGEGYLLDRITLDWAIGRYAPKMDLADIRLSPLRALDFAGLPSAHIHTAEFDPLRDEGKAYADSLARAGVPVRYVCHAGMIHHFYCMAGAIAYARHAIAQAGAAIQEALAPR
jgi:acetyl esterase